MHPILDDLITVAGRLSFSPPTIPVLSGVHGTVVLPGDALAFNAHYIARHCAEPVMFDEGISASLGIPEFANATAWIEIGPDSSCLSILKQNLRFPSHVLLLGSLWKHQDAWATLSETSKQLY